MIQHPLGQVEIESGQIENVLPCPFCAAASDLVLLRHAPGARYAFVGCATCKAAGPIHEDAIGAVTAWNTRYFYQDDAAAPAML